MDWLNSNSGAITAIATAVLVFITAVYVYFTYRILRATNQPEIMVSLRPSEVYGYFAVLRVENVGSGVARNVKFMGDLSRSVDGRTQLKEIVFVKNGISVFGPGQNIDHYFFGTLEIPEALKPVPIELIVTYSDSSEHHQNRRTFRLNFSECEGTLTTSASPIDEIAKATREIQEDLHRLTSRLTR